MKDVHFWWTIPLRSAGHLIARTTHRLIDFENMLSAHPLYSHR